MRKRLIALAMTLCVAITMIAPAFAANDVLPSGTVVFREGLDIKQIAGKTVLCINYSELDRIADNAKEILDSGTMLFITNPEASAEDVAVLLSIPKTNTTSYQTLLLMAYSIYKLNDTYIFANHYATFASEGEGNKALGQSPADVIDQIDAPLDVTQKDTISNFSNAILMSEYLKNKAGIASVIDPMDAVSSAISAKADMETNLKNTVVEATRIGDGDVQPKSSTLPSATATQTWNDILYVYSLTNQQYGYLNCTVYGYAKGTGLVNGSNKKIYDVVSAVKAYPKSGYKVRRYQTQLRCNFTNFNCLQTTTLPSGINYSQQLSLTGSYGSSGGSGGGTFTTGWTYNPESQVITESSPAPRIVINGPINT